MRYPMRGKKIDTDFLSEFIQECVMLGIDSPEAITLHAKKLITQIDEDIKAVEKKKVKRSKLLDVVTSFEKPQKPSKVEEAKLLPFFKLQHPNICKDICQKLKQGPVLGTDLTKNNQDNIFCIKQLLECKVISKIGTHIVCGDKYNEYMKFVLQEK